MQMSNRNPSPRWHYGFALLLGIAITASFVAMILPIVYLYRDPDTSNYLEAARNVLAGKGLLVSGSLDNLPLATVPMSLWPPGYPMLIAFGSKLLGADPMWLAPRLAWASWALLPPALLFTLRPVLMNRSIYIVSLLVMLAPGAIDNAWQPMSDIPFLLLTIFSLGLLFRGSFPDMKPGLLILSGIVGALAYSFRNVGIALFLSVAGAYLALALLKLQRPRDVVLRALYWGAGAAVILIPLEVRNLSVFGSLQPYHMAPSTLGLIANVHYFLIAVVIDLIARPGLKGAILWNNAFLFALGAGAIALLAIYRKALAHLWGEWPTAKKEMFVLLVCNFIAGAAVVILARSRYQWGEFIGPRHLLQYDWLLFAGSALLLEQAGQMSKRALVVISISAAAFIGFRAVYAFHEIRSDQYKYTRSLEASLPSDFPSMTPDDTRITMQMAIARDRALIRAISNLPTDTILISNYEDVIKAQTASPALRVIIEKDCQLPTPLAASPGDRRMSAKLAVLLFPNKELMQSGCWRRLEQMSKMQLPLSVTRPYLISFGEDNFAMGSSHPQ